MNNRTFVALSLLFLSSMAEAQTKVEVSRITCDQYISFKINDPQKIAIWLSGYYNGMIKNTTLDLSLFEERAKRVNDYCYKNPKVKVMDSIEKIFKRGDAK